MEPGGSAGRVRGRPDPLPVAAVARPQERRLQTAQTHKHLVLKSGRSGVPPVGTG